MKISRKTYSRYLDINGNYILSHLMHLVLKIILGNMTKYNKISFKVGDFFPPWRCGPKWAMASSFLKFVDHTQRRITVGRTPLDE